MAENENINGNNNNKAKSSTSNLSFEDCNGRTESDAVHARLRNDLHDKSTFVCQSCKSHFQATSLIQVYEHYKENAHGNCFGLCFYCRGEVHQYYEERTRRMHIYHNCLRCKRGENK